MNIKSLYQYRIFVWLLASMILSLIVGCGSVNTYLASQSKYNEGNDVARPDELKDAFLLETADRFGLMALFAEIVYRRDLADDLKNSAGCRYLEQGQEDVSRPGHGMPPGWTRWIPTPTAMKEMEGAFPCFGRSGLYYETYIFTNSEKITTEAVIAFRGTENRSGEYIDDWSSNFAAAFAFEPKQYELASKQVPLMIAGLKAQYNQSGNRIKIYATGHSLGGGLAQQAGYLSKDILEVFTFNTSPVTNWSSLRKRKEIRNAYPVIHRIYHGGEALEKARFVSTSSTQARYARHDIGLQFGDVERSLFPGHDMRIIACNFAHLISIQDQEHDAAHHYSAKFIKQHVLVTGDPPPSCVTDTAICRIGNKKVGKCRKDPTLQAQTSQHTLP